MATITGTQYYGSCPLCGKTDGYLDTPGGHVFVCDTHKTSWLVGSGLFTVEASDDELRANRDKLAVYREVEPLALDQTFEVSGSGED